MEKPFSPIRRLKRRPELGDHKHVVRVGAKDHFHFVVCSDDAEWFCGHWDGQRKCTIRCSEPVEQCEGHLAMLPLREKGYLTVCHRTRVSTALLLELTPGAGQYIAEAFPEGECMRGAIIHCFRYREVLNGPLVIERVGKFDEIGALPHRIDPLPTLMRLWAAA